MPAAGDVCVHCGLTLGMILNRGTLARSDVVACEHCDNTACGSDCKRCARMRKTVRIVDKPKE